MSEQVESVVLGLIVASPMAMILVALAIYFYGG